MNSRRFHSITSALPRQRLRHGEAERPGGWWLITSSNLSTAPRQIRGLLALEDAAA